MPDKSLQWVLPLIPYLASRFHGAETLWYLSSKLTERFESTTVTGPDKILLAVKNLRPDLFPILAKLLNWCLKENCFPISCKLSTVQFIKIRVNAHPSDNVWHTGLLHKLSSDRISGRDLSVMKSLLSGKSMKVVVISPSSVAHEIKAAFPQGSPLGPTLFISIKLRICLTRLSNF